MLQYSGEFKDRALKKLQSVAKVLITDGKDTLPNIVNQDLAYSTGRSGKVIMDHQTCTYMYMCIAIYIQIINQLQKYLMYSTSTKNLQQ